MSVLFASDVHLSARRPHRVQAFLDFLGGPCRGAERVVLLGDVFDEWLGDDDVRAPHPQVVSALAALSGAGVRVDFCAGNHDFLTGRRFHAETGCRRLEDESVIEVFGHHVLVLHGDRLCTRDLDYQRWRAFYSDPQRQAQFLALPFDERVSRASTLRHASMSATALKPDAIMDVAPEAVVEAFARHGVDCMIHGHTHRPGVHPPGSGAGTRIVLGDWYDEEHVLRWDAGGPMLAPLRALFG